MVEYPKRILVVGNGGRECALANACLLSREIEQLIITPANWGVVDHLTTSRIGVLDIKASDNGGIVVAAVEHRIDLAIVGPEDPLVAGLADDLRAAGISVLGPGRETAQLEGSKLYAKQFMQQHNIPHGGYREFTDADALLDYCRSSEIPLVLKADGLAAGKGVIVCSTADEAVSAAERLMVEREFGDAGSMVVAEERLFGREISWTCLIGGSNSTLIGISTDYKPLLDGDEGPNTGGMGNICPTPFATPEITREFHENILNPLMAGLAADGLDYRGFLFVGTMLNDDGLKVLEFNVRLGDPEAAVVLPMNDADWPAVFAGIARGEAVELPRMKQDAACVAVVIASGNYPYRKSEPAEIRGLDRIYERGLLTGSTSADGTALPGQVSIFFAGVSRQSVAESDSDSHDQYVPYFSSLDKARFMATGGRVINVSALGRDLSDARRLAYEVAGNIQFDGMQFRSDIGQV